MDKTKTIAALFDFDGVVMDTESQYTIYWNEVGKQYHPKIENFGLLIKGQTLSQIYDRFFKGMDAEQAEITKGLDKFESEMEYEYVPGVVEFMKELRNNGVKIAIVTSSNEKKMSNVYSSHPELKGLVDRILTAEMFTRSKPAPDCFLLGAKVFDTVPENSVVFEDSFHGLQAGKSAGMLVVGLSTTNSKEAIKDKCDVVIPDFSNFTFSDLISLLNK
ncbi:HAD family phosphatase [uncultured Bacteroides sp.]|uniref:HAD family hydrolase n=1 Tax=uncultured Bacteroides sp. TaxID=162156 RepID=UPI0026270DF8|nr:HAD family hydrolase [uncultured Bacteroides sp.]